MLTECEHPPYYRRRMYDHGKLRCLWCNYCGSVSGDPENFKVTPWYVPIAQGGMMLTRNWVRMDKEPKCSDG